MRRNDRENHAEKIFKRFILSFMTVLILPIVFFTIIFFKDFYQIYQQKIIEQAKISLNDTMMGLERDLEGLHSVVSYNSLLDHMQDYRIKKDSLADEVMTSLCAEVISHSILEGMYYYTSAVPERIYSASGTYSLDYFLQFYVGEENKQDFFEICKNMENAEWRIWQYQEKAGGSTQNRIYYIIKYGAEKLWIFELSQECLEEILSGESGNTILLDAEGNQLFPFAEAASTKEPVSIEEENEKYYFITSESFGGSFQMVRKISKQALWEELYRCQSYFFLTLAIVLLLGGSLVFLLSNYNERPIRELQDYCRQRIGDIPETLEGFEMFRFAMGRMENRIILMEEKRKMNKLLLQLVFGREGDARRILENMKEVNLFCHAQIYRVILVVAEEKKIDFSRVELYLKTEGGEKYEFQMVDIAYDNQAMFIVGMPAEAGKYLEEDLKKMYHWFDSNLNVRLCFFVGEECKTPEEIQPSYLGVVECNSKNPADFTERIIYCKSGRNDVVCNLYPDIELNTLYEALVETDYDKASVLTDFLIEDLKAHDEDRFYSVSIYYDVLNAYYRAQSTLALNTEVAMPEIELLEIKNNADAIRMIHNIKEQYKSYISGIKDKKDKNLISRIIEFIDENKEDYNLSVSMVADCFDMSISNLSHRFKQQTNLKINDYITEKKFEYAGELLSKTDLSVQEISDRMGYTQSSSFIRKFKQHFGVTPVEYRSMKKENGKDVGL